MSAAHDILPQGVIDEDYAEHYEEAEKELLANIEAQDEDCPFCRGTGHANAADGANICPSCRVWKCYMGHWDQDGYTLRCHGCLRAVLKCVCGGWKRIRF